MKRIGTYCAILLVVTGVLGCSTGARETSVSYNNKEGIVQFRGQDIMRYQFGDVPFKPYVRELYSPSGVQVLRDAPSDHLHHHALMFAFAIDGVDFWAETPGCGKQVHKSNSILANVTSSEFGQLVEQLDWMGPAGVLMHEERLLNATIQQGASILTWRSTLSLPAGKDTAKISGSHYFGLGARFAETMDKGSRFIYADGPAGQVVRGDERLTAGKWCAVQGKANGKDVTIAMFDGARNPRPAAWFTMNDPFAYLSATMRLHETPMEMKAGQTMNLCYGVAVWDGHVSVETIGAACEQWRKK